LNQKPFQIISHRLIAYCTPKGQGHHKNKKNF
jgi:hypothetical protein